MSRNQKWCLSMIALTTALSLVVSLNAQNASEESKAEQWRVAGENLRNTGSKRGEHLISPANVNRLSPKWVFTTGGDVSATPTVADDAVYFPDWGGNLFAVKKNDGHLIWSHKISDYNGVVGSVSRVSPAVDGNHVFIGDIFSEAELHNGANVMSVDRKQLHCARKGRSLPECYSDGELRCGRRFLRYCSGVRFEDGAGQVGEPAARLRHLDTCM